MNGESDSIDKKLEEELKRQEAYAKQCALPLLTTDTENEVKKIMSATPAALKKLTAEECGEAAFMLTQYSLYLQRQVNKELRIMEWCEELQDKMLYKDYPQRKGASFAERRLVAVNANPTTLRVDNIRVQAKLRLRTISHLSQIVTKMADRIGMLQHSRRKADGH